jgi:hypothetical protein
MKEERKKRKTDFRIASRRQRVPITPFFSVSSCSIHRFSFEHTYNTPSDRLALAFCFLKYFILSSGRAIACDMEQVSKILNYLKYIRAISSQMLWYILPILTDARRGKVTYLGMY